MKLMFTERSASSPPQADEVLNIEPMGGEKGTQKKKILSHWTD